MAASTVTMASAPLNEFATAASFTALDGTDGAVIDFGGKDCFTLLLFTCSVADATLTIKGGNGAKGVPDLPLSIAKDAYNGIVIDSAYYKQVSGTNKGKVLVTGKATTSVMAIELKPGR